MTGDLSLLQVILIIIEWFIPTAITGFVLSIIIIANIIEPEDPMKFILNMIAM